MCFPCGIGLHRVLRSATVGLLTPGKPVKHDVCANSVVALDFAADIVVTHPQYELSSEDIDTMNSSEDEPLSGLNGRLRPRRTTSSPQAKMVKKLESKTSQDRPKRTSTPSKAFSNKTDDLANKSDSFPVTLFLCPYCDRKFSTKQTVSKHARRMHLSTSKQDCFIACLFCNHTEAEANDIIRHMVDSHPNQYFACLDCHTRFPSTSELAEHKLNVCEKQKPYRSKLRQKSSSSLKRNQKNLNTDRKDDFSRDKEYSHGFNGIVISCELKPSQVHDEADIEDNITTNLILPPSKSLASSAVIEKNAVIVLDDIQWNKRIPPNFSFHNTDADQILSRLGVVHRSPRTGESTRRDWFKTIDDSTQKFEKCFDTSFYSKVASNVQENLSKCLDGSFNFNPDLDNTIKTRKAKNSVVINTAEGFPILLAFEQYSRNMFDSYMPRSIAPKHKWKWDNLETDKTVISPDQIQRDSHTNNCIITLVSSLDIWTQLRMRKKFEDKFNITHVKKKTEKQNLIDKELKEILESREIPPSSSHLVKYTNNVAPTTDKLDIPSYLGLTPSAPKYDLQPAVLSGEWVRPRCYVCCACGAQTRDCKALSSHISIQHPNAQVQHYEIVGEPLLNADILKHLYVPPSQVANRTRPLRGIRDCTKCKKSITLEELHQHMLDCAGDTPTVRRNKCRYRPFGVRRRRPRLPDNTIRRKIRKDMRNRHKQKNHMRPRQKIRSEVGDAETIRRMIADLPAKRHRVLLNPTNQALRPRRKIEKQRGKLILKHRSTDEAKKRNLRIVKDLNNTTKLEKTKTNDKEEQKRSNTPIRDDDDKPLKPKRRLTANNSRHTSLKRKTVVTRAKRKIKIKNDTLANLSELENAGPSNELPKEGPPVNNASQRIDVNNSHSSARQHSGRGGNFNRGNNQEAREGNVNDNDNNNVPLRQNDEINNGAPVQNSPLKHSIARLTADTERHDKSVQFQPHFLIQQECNNTNQHVPTGQQELFENEAPDVTLDKPPLASNQNVPTDPSTLQKNKIKGSRKGLNACIDMLRNKLADQPIGSSEEPVPDLPVHSIDTSVQMSAQRGNIDPIDPRYLQGPPINHKMDPNPAEIYSHSVIPEGYKNLLPYQKYMAQTQLAYQISSQPSESALTDNEKLALSQVKAQLKEGDVRDIERPDDSHALQQTVKTPVKRQSSRLKSSATRNTQPTMFGLPSQIEVIPQKPTGSPKKTPQSRQTKNSEQELVAKEPGVTQTDSAPTNLKDLEQEYNVAKLADYHKKISGGPILDSMPSTSFQQPVDIPTIQKKLFSEQGALGGITISHGDPEPLNARSKSSEQHAMKTQAEAGPIHEPVMLPEQIALLQKRPYGDPRSYSGSIPCMPPIPFSKIPGGYSEPMTYPNFNRDFALLAEQQRIYHEHLFGPYPQRVPGHQIRHPEQMPGPSPLSGQATLPEQRLSTDSDIQLTKEKMLLPEQGLSNQRRCTLEKQPDSASTPPERRTSTEHWVANEHWPSLHISPTEKQYFSKEQLRVIESQSSSNELNKSPEINLVNDHRLTIERRTSTDKSTENKTLNAWSLLNDSASTDDETLTEDQRKIIERLAQNENLISREQLISNNQKILLQKQTYHQVQKPQPECGAGSENTNLNKTLSEQSQTLQQKLANNRRKSETRLSTDVTVSENKSSIERQGNQSIQSGNQRFRESKFSQPVPNACRSTCATSPCLEEVHSERDVAQIVPIQKSMVSTRRNLPPHVKPAHLFFNSPEICELTPLDLSAKKSSKESEIPTKNLDLPARKPDLSARMPDLPARKPDLPAKELDLQARKLDLPAKSPVADLSANQCEQEFVPTSSSATGMSGENIRSQHAPHTTNVRCYEESNNSSELHFIPEHGPLAFIDLTQDDESWMQDYGTIRVKTELYEHEIEENNTLEISPNYTTTDNCPINRIPAYRKNQHNQYLNVMESKSRNTIFKQSSAETGLIRSREGLKTSAGASVNFHRGISTSLPHSFPASLNRANIDPSLPVSTLPNPVSATTAAAHKHESTVPVYTVAKIETSSSATSTNALLSIPSTTVANTKSVFTMAGVVPDAQLNFGDMAKSNSLNYANSENSIQANIDNNESVESEIKIANNGEKATQDPEMAKKIAMLPKELVEVLQTMPASHRNQLLNILPQYLSTSSSSTKSNSDTTVTNVNSSDINKSSISNPMMASPEQQRMMGMHGLIPNYLISSNIQQYTSQFFKSFNMNERHALSYLLQPPPPPPPPPQPEFSVPPPTPYQPLPVTATQNRHVVHHQLLTPPLIPLPPNTPPSYARHVQLIKTDESGEDVKPLVGTIKPKEEKDIESSSGIDNTPRILLAESVSGTPNTQKDCSDKRIIDLTEAGSTNVTECVATITKGQSKSIIVPTTNITNYTAFVQTQKFKIGNDKTASLRAVRIKTASERNKSSADSQMSNNMVIETELPMIARPVVDEANQLGSKTTSLTETTILTQPVDQLDQQITADRPLIQHDSGDSKSPELNISLAIQQAEISSTQQNKNNTVPSKLSVVEPPTSPDLSIEIRPDTPPNNEMCKSTRKSANIIIKKDKDHHQIEIPSPSLGMVTSSVSQRNSPNIEPIASENHQLRHEQLLKNDNKDQTLTLPKDFAGKSTTTNLIPSDNDHQRPIPKILTPDNGELQGDDSDDDVSLAVIVKNRDSLKNMTCMSKLGENISSPNNTSENQKNVERKKREEHSNLNTRKSIGKLSTEKKPKKTDFQDNNNTRIVDIIQNEHNSEIITEIATVKHQDDIKIASRRSEPAQDGEFSETGKRIVRLSTCDDQKTKELNDNQRIITDEDIESENLKSGIGKKTEKSVQVSDFQFDTHSTEKSFDSDLKLCSEIDENYATPLRRSRRGKSMYVDSASIEQDTVNVPEVCHEQRTPLTKKQLIFSKLLLDEENHTVPQAYSTPQYNIKAISHDIQENIETPVVIISQPPNKTVIEKPQTSNVEKRKVPKRKKTVKIKRKNKKKKSIEVDSEIIKEQDKEETTDVAATSDSESTTEVKNNSALIECNHLNPSAVSQEDLASDDLDIKEGTSESLSANTEKRKLDASTVDICDKNLKTKKPKLLIKTDSDLEKKCENNNETNITQLKEKTSTAGTRTACYMPAAARRTRSKSVIVKSSTADFYDPYDIDLDDMIEKTESFKYKKYTHNLKADSEDHKSMNSSEKSETAGEYSNEPNLKKPVKNKDHPEIDSDIYKTTAAKDMSDSDDSSKSDVPLKKYIEHKEKKSLQSSKSTATNQEDDDNNQERTKKHLNTKGNKQQKKSRRTLATFNNVDKSSVNNDADERRSEQFMESFGFFSERKPRKSNLLASKKISETFHIIANESDDAYFSSKNRANKRGLQNENKKSAGGDRIRSRQMIGKKIIKRAPLAKKQVCLPVPTYCRICRRQFRRSDNFMRHQMTLYHISKLSEAELNKKTFPIIEEPNYLVVFRQQLEHIKKLTKKVARNRNDPKYAKMALPTLDEILVKVHKIVERQLLAQRGLSRDEALFLDCCQLLKSNKHEVNNVDKPILNIEPDRYMCTQCLLKQYELLEKSGRDDGDVDSITAKNILESEEVRNLEKDLISGLTEAANASTLKAKIDYPRSVSDESENQEDDHTTDDTCLNEEGTNYEQKDIDPATNLNKAKKLPEVKDKMYPDIIESIDMFEDKFDKIKRKCRSQAAAAKQTQPVIEPSISQKARRKPEKKTVRRNSKKIRQGSQVLTKGALKGFDGIKVSISKSDINMAAITSLDNSSSKKKKKNSSKKKRERDLESHAKHNSQPHKDSGSSSKKDIDVYEFMDNEDAEVFEFRPSTLVERFKSISNKDTPSTSKTNPVIDENENMSGSGSDGDDFVYDDYACSDDETKSSISCELNHNKVNTEVKKTVSPLKRKDVTEKNAVMGKIFKHNAVRAEKKIVQDIEPDTEPNMDELFDSLLETEPNSSISNNEASTPKKDDYETPKIYDKYNCTSPTRDECVSPPMIRDIISRSPSPADYKTSSLKCNDSKFIDLNASTSKQGDEYSKIIDSEPSTSKKHDITLAKGVRASSPKKLDMTSSKKHDAFNKHKSRRHSGSSPKRNDRSPKTHDLGEKPAKEKSPSTNLDEGISTSYDYSADVLDQYYDMGVARQRARRKCTVGKQNVLAETWSSESEPDGLPPRPNSAESVVLSATRKRKGKKRDSQSGGRRNRHISFKRQDDIRVSNSNRSAASNSGAGGSDIYDAPTASTSHAPFAPPSSGSKPRPRSSTYYWSSEGDDEQEHLQQHGWIVGDSHKKLVTMLAHAKGRKRNNDDKSHFVE